MSKQIYFAIIALFSTFQAYSQFMDVPDKVCLDASKDLQLRAGGGKTYKWVGPNGFLSNEQNPIIKNISENNSGAYQVLIDGLYPFSSQIMIGKGSQPQLNYYLTNQNTLYFYTNGLTYGNDFKITGPNNFQSSNYSGEIKSLTPKNQGIYVLETTDSYGCPQTANFAFKMKDTVCYEVPKMKIISDGLIAESHPMIAQNYPQGSYNRSSFCNKAKISFEIEADNLSSGTVKWYRDSKIIAENTNSINFTGAASYQVTFVKGGCVYSEYPVLVETVSSVNPHLELFNQRMPRDTLTICSSKNYTESSIAFKESGIYLRAGNENYEIYKDGIKIKDNGSSRYYYGLDNGTYRVKANFDGCSSLGQEVVVKTMDNILPNITTFGVDFSENINFCKSVMENGFYLLAEFPGVLKLKKDGSDITSSRYSISNYIKESGNYTLEYASGDGCTGSQNFKVIASNKMVGTVTKYSYNNPCSTQEYLYPSLNLQGSTLNSVKWYTRVNGVEINVGNGYTYYPKDTRSYYYKLESIGCSVVSSEKNIVLNGTQKMEFDEFSTVNICDGETYFLKLKNCAIGKVDWYKDNKFLISSYECGLTVNEAGNYSFKLPNCSLSHGSVNVQLTSLKKPVITTICNDSNVTIKLEQGNLPEKVEWFRDEVLLESDLNKYLIDGSIFGRYSARISSKGCFKTTELSQVGISSNFSSAICRGTIVKLSPSARFESYNWVGPSNFSSKSDSLILKDFGPNNAGEYTLTVKSANSCQFSEKFMLFNADLPDFDLPTDLTTCKGDNLMNYIKPKGLNQTSEASSSEVAIRYSDNLNANFFSIQANSGLDKDGKYHVSLFSNTYASYSYEGKSYGRTCSATKTVDVKLSDNVCKKISVPDIAKMKVCFGEDVSIPFDVIGQASYQDKDFKMWYRVSPYYQYFESQVVLDTTNALKLSPSNGVFVIPRSSFSQNEYSYLVFTILPSDKSIVPYSKFVQLSFGNRYDVSFSMTKTCEGFEIAHANYFPESIVLDSMFVFKENIFFGKTNKNVFRTETPGNYQVRTKYKNKNSDYYDGSLECLTESRYVNFNTSNYKLAYISSSSNSYCHDGYQILKLVYNSPSPDKLLEVQWFRDNILIEKFNNLSEIRITENGIYHAKVKFIGCLETTSPFEFKKENYSLKYFNFQVNNQFISSDYFDKQTINICPFATNNLKVFIYPWNYNYFKQLSLSFNYQLFKGNTILKEGIIRESEMNIPISESGDYFVRTSTPFCSNISKTFSIQEVVKETTTETEIVKMCNNRAFNYNLQYSAKGLLEKSLIIDVELFKNGQSIKKDRLDSRTELKHAVQLTQSGKYYYQVNHKYEKGTCSFNSRTLDLNINDTLFIGKENVTVSTCDSPVYMSFESSEAQYYNELQRTWTDVWFRNDKSIANTRKLSQYTTKEPGAYKIFAKTKEGCTIISPEYKINSGKLDAQIKLGDPEFSNLQCRNSQNSFMYVQLSSSVEDYNKLSYEYFKDDKLIKKVSYNMENSELEISATGIFYAKIKYPGCDSETGKIEIKSLPKQPSIIPTGGIEICNGKAVTLKVFNAKASNIIWEKNGEILFNQGDSIKVEKPGQYAVYVNEPDCHIESGLLNIRALELPKSLNLKGTLEFCPKDTIYLQTQTLDESILYGLLRNNQKTTSNYKGIFPINLKGEYSISQSRNNCQLTTESVELVPKLDNELTLSDSSFCKGSNVSLSAVSNQGYSYTWFKNGKLIEDTKTNILKINTEGSYKALLSSKDCEAFSSEIFVSEKPELTATIKGDTTINFGDNAALIINFTSSPPYSFTINSESPITTSLNPYRYMVAPQMTSNYSINKLSNICGEGKGVGSAEVKVLVLSLGLENKIKIFPNPSSDFISFEGDLSDIKEIIITSSNGKNQIVAEKYLGNDIKITNWAPGVYIVKMVFKNRVEEFKLLKL